MIAVLVNAIGVFFASLVGRSIGHRIPTKIQESIISIIAVAVLVMGVSYGQKGSMILTIISLVIGIIVGELIDIDGALLKLGVGFKKLFKTSSSDTTFVEGFVTSTLLFCVGSMAILGSFEAGISKNYELIYTKSLMDSITAIVLASSLGIGVGLSSISILVYQGALTLLSSLIAPFFTQGVIDNISGVGGIMLIAISLQMLRVKEFKTANMLPALLVPIIYDALMGIIF